MSYKYILIEINNNQLEGYYLTFPQTSYLLKKYKVYIFRCKSDKDILYLNDKIEHHYSSSRINKIDDNNKAAYLKKFNILLNLYEWRTNHQC